MTAITPRQMLLSRISAMKTHGVGLHNMSAAFNLLFDVMSYLVEHTPEQKS